MFGHNFLGIWLVMTLSGGGLCMLLSSITFARCYWKPTFEQWQFKSNPKFPPADKIRKEILQTAKCLSLSTLLPALSIYLTAQGQSQAFCGWGGRSLSWHVASAVLMFVGSDFFEWSYHMLGHKISFLWAQHKSHHAFFNPSPFAVVADEAIDQIVRSTPLFAFPLLMPTNMDVLFTMFALFFYAYGVYLHCGYELAWPDAHHPFINTSYQHYLHHAVGASGKPAHTGFFVKIWDQLAGGDLTAEMLQNGSCTCAKCCRARGERSLEAWQKVEKPDYSPLFKLGFWLKGSTA